MGGAEVDEDDGGFVAGGVDEGAGVGEDGTGRDSCGAGGVVGDAAVEGGVVVSARGVTAPSSAGGSLMIPMTDSAPQQSRMSGARITPTRVSGLRRDHHRRAAALTPVPANGGSGW